MGTPKIGMSFLMWTPEFREEHLPLLDQLRDMGFDGVELPLVDTSFEMLERAAMRCEELGLERTGVGFATAEADPISPDPLVRMKAVAHIEELCRKADVLGAPLLGGPIHSAYATFSGVGPQEEQLKRSADVLARAAETAASLGVRLGLEYLNRFECYLVTSAAETEALVKRVGHPSLCTVLDTHHSHIEDSEVGQAIRGCAETLGHVQLSESHRGFLGQGQVHWGSVFDALADIHYDDWLIIEAFSRHDPEFAAGLHIWRDPATDLMDIPRRGLAFVRRHLGLA
ncbi:MAG: D-psicose/D-tagatose/L-ribulose 3-epimerase [Planctomycetota bacterium]|jgi:D-psicose/D-tagatose/L-ribulose 3-epimerase